eukprot:GDKI01034742.1.p1 GENE.GDKI01034742.1~~GDKI01034742.1.p1  ORF type:complete len:102 (-),score=23.32 GDKI01034742.1:516-821(-)
MGTYTFLNVPCGRLNMRVSALLVSIALCGLLATNTSDTARVDRRTAIQGHVQNAAANMNQLEAESESKDCTTMGGPGNCSTRCTWKPKGTFTNPTKGKCCC